MSIICTTEENTKAPVNVDISGNLHRISLTMTKGYPDIVMKTAGMSDKEKKGGKYLCLNIHTISFPETAS